MEFNPDTCKCEILSISRKKHPVTFLFNLHGQQFKSTEAAKYLDVTISKDLSWTHHIHNITAKANNSLRVIKRNFKLPTKRLKKLPTKLTQDPS
jgi:hypothetical protein